MFCTRRLRLQNETSVLYFDEKKRATESWPPSVHLKWRKWQDVLIIHVLTRCNSLTVSDLGTSAKARTSDQVSSKQPIRQVKRQLLPRNIFIAHRGDSFSYTRRWWPGWSSAPPSSDSERVHIYMNVYPIYFLVHACTAFDVTRTHKLRYSSHKPVNRNQSDTWLITL